MNFFELLAVNTAVIVGSGVIGAAVGGNKHPTAGPLIGVALGNALLLAAVAGYGGAFENKPSTGTGAPPARLQVRFP